MQFARCLLSTTCTLFIIISIIYFCFVFFIFLFTVKMNGNGKIIDFVPSSIRFCTIACIRRRWHRHQNDERILHFVHNNFEFSYIFFFRFASAVNGGKKWTWDCKDDKTTIRECLLGMHSCVNFVCFHMPQKRFAYQVKDDGKPWRQRQRLCMSTTNAEIACIAISVLCLCTKIAIEQHHCNNRQ